MRSAGAAGLGWGLALRQAAHVAEDQLPEVRDAGAAEVIGLAVEVIHLLGGQLNGDALATGGKGYAVQATTPTPHSLTMPTTARARRWVPCGVEVAGLGLWSARVPSRTVAGSSPARGT
jgi:hypothetical protein